MLSHKNLTLLLVTIVQIEGLKSNRESKLLNVFNIVKFPNSGCNSTTLNTYGVCYTASECTSLDGSSAGSCASGFGVCCTFSGGCGGTTQLNNTYFKSSTSDTSPCTFSVCKSASDICQIRLGFDTFAINQPVTSTASAAPYTNGRTQCQTAQFTANSDGPATPVICGTNTGYHMILEAKENCNTLSFTWTSSTTRSWNIHIMQIPCTATWKPPEDCRQYFTGTTGYIYSYNYQGSYHLASQQYMNCIRPEQGYCSIAYSAITFQVSSTTATATSTVSDSCSQDYIQISGGGASAGATTNYDRFCGGLFANTNAATTAATVYTNKMPFQVGVNFDATEVDAASSLTEKSTGFCLYYKQTACT